MVVRIVPWWWRAARSASLAPPADRVSVPARHAGHSAAVHGRLLCHGGRQGIRGHNLVHPACRRGPHRCGNGRTCTRRRVTAAAASAVASAAAACAAVGQPRGRVEPAGLFAERVVEAGDCRHSPLGGVWPPPPRRRHRRRLRLLLRRRPERAPQLGEELRLERLRGKSPNFQSANHLSGERRELPRRGRSRQNDLVGQASNAT
mmetsp:Transcript_30619/g.76679  ORF Transcript_30619/g.76679 Transcript_30619/m.76679 type:complete len:204 (-) Transcript_30619:1749-2360(-)